MAVELAANGAVKVWNTWFGGRRGLIAFGQVNQADKFNHLGERALKRGVAGKAEWAVGIA